MAARRLGPGVGRSQPRRRSRRSGAGENHPLFQSRRPAYGHDHHPGRNAGTCDHDSPAALVRHSFDRRRGPYRRRRRLRRRRHAAEFQGQCQRGVGGRDGGSRLGRRHTFEGRSRHVRPHRGYARGERRGRAERYADHPGRHDRTAHRCQPAARGANPGHRRRRPYR